MVNFDVSKNWAILLPLDQAFIKKATEDLTRYIGLLAAMDAAHPPKPLPFISASEPAPDHTVPVLILNNANNGSEQNGFSWRATPERVEILGDSGRGLCNGIYSFLAALGLSWPAPGQEKLPSSSNKDFPLAFNKAHESSNASSWRRFVVEEKKTIRELLKKSDDLAAWAARQRYDALVFPLAAFASKNTGSKLRQLKESVGEYDIQLEAGGRDLSSLLPRRHFILHRDYFRMTDGRREKDHHFCPTSPGTIRIAGKEAEKLFRAADVKTYHLWPDREAESAWCSCPSCRAFTPPEQNRIAVNIAADVLSAMNPEATLTYFEKSSEGIKVPMRKNSFRMEEPPD